jgi:hypothetical protein
MMVVCCGLLVVVAWVGPVGMEKMTALHYQ